MIVNALDKALPSKRPLGHHDPYINAKELKNVTEALSRGITSGYFKAELEGKLAEVCGVRHAVAVSSGTAALHLALLALGVQPGDEVIVPSMTFVACANAIKYCGAIPHFIDGALTVGPTKLRTYLESKTVENPDGNRDLMYRSRLNPKTNRVISAAIIVDLLGFPADWPRLSSVASEFGLAIIEDAAQALGSMVGDRPCGSFGNAATLSFNNNKIVTGNGGGAILTNDEWIWAKASHLSQVARVPHPWKVEHDSLGFNYRISEMSAAMICAQLDQLPEFIKAKIQIREMYEKALSGMDNVTVLKATKEWHWTPNYWLTAIAPTFKGEYDFEAIMKGLHDRGILARAMFTPLHKLPHLTDCPRDMLGYAEYTAKDRMICLPSGVGLVM